jgi:ABC-2 type transport system permease protein
MNKLALLLKREYWEHRGGFFWAPVWTCVTILVVTVFGILTAEVVGRRNSVHLGFSLDRLKSSLDANDMIQAGNALDMVQLMFGAVTCLVLFFVLFFYLLGALYDDRRDRSVLFWKSLPVSDGSTVLSKAIAAMLFAPLLSFVVATAAYLVFLLVVTLWTAAHGVNVLPAIAAAHPFGMFWRLLLTIPVDALWALPTVGWLLFWSAFARSKPFLWAVVLPLLAVFLNFWFGALGLPNFDNLVAIKDVAARLLLSVMPGGWLGDDTWRAMQWRFNDEDVMRNFDPARVYALLGTVNLWIGAVVGVALVAAATWMRGRRIEVNT